MVCRRSHVPDDVFLEVRLVRTLRRRSTGAIVKILQTDKPARNYFT